jgi:hypothetical protein
MLAKSQIMGARLLRCLCPHCAFLVVETARVSALLECPRCCHKFRPSGRKKVPLWVFGVLAVVAANLCAILLR